MIPNLESYYAYNKRLSDESKDLKHFIENNYRKAFNFKILVGVTLIVKDLSFVKKSDY
jgi:hypothetical protein